MSNRDFVIKFMSNIKDRTPILLIANAAKIFYHIYSGRIYNVRNEDDMTTIKNMSISKLTKPVVISDLSSLYDDEDLLKIIEESDLQFILLAFRDNLSEVLVSRCKSVLKLTDLEVKQCNYISKKSALSALEQFDSNIDAANMYLTENCPALMRDINDARNLKYKDKVVNILANIGSDKQ